MQASPEISGLIFLSLLIYCCHNNETDPSAIRDQMNKLLLLVKHVNDQLLYTHSGMIHRYESRFPEDFLLDDLIQAMIDEVAEGAVADSLKEEQSSQFKALKKTVESPTTVHTIFSPLSCDEGNNAMVSQTGDDLSHLSI